MKDQGICVRKLSRVSEGNIQKDKVETVLGTHTRTEILPVLTSQTENSITHEELGRVLRKVLLSSRNINPQLSTLQMYLTCHVC